MSWHLWLEYLEHTRGERGAFLDWAAEHGSQHALTWDVFKEMRLSSPEREAIIPYMDDDCLKRDVEVLVQNCGRMRHGAVTYEDAVIFVMVPELLKRLGRSGGSVHPQVDMEFVASASTPLETAFMFDVRSCPRCNRDHGSLPFVDLAKPPPAVTHCANCPETGEPILVRIRKKT